MRFLALAIHQTYFIFQDVFVERFVVNLITDQEEGAVLNKEFVFFTEDCRYLLGLDLTKITVFKFQKNRFRVEFGDFDNKSDPNKDYKIMYKIS